MNSHGLHSLVVDDSKIVRRVTRGILEDLGYKVDEAEDGSVALAMCEASLPDLILLDWHMPVMNGLSFLKALRTLPDGAKPAVMFCTTETNYKCIQQALEAGAQEYVMKPYDENIIKNKLIQLGLPHDKN